MTEAKIAAVGKHESILLFSAAGVKTVSADTDAQALQAVKNLIKNGAEVIFLTENYAAALEEQLSRYRESAYPILLPVPEKAARQATDLQKSMPLWKKPLARIYLIMNKGRCRN